ncbi:hypothetical protein FNV43_RR26544 [Rhamnella rubrinervis]|uniref:Methanol O-anthraniloyltransferase-like n=1 Tax=Rhamnella rubrinervis TaxID=2594499 RepID=A0A8K0DPH8_9ROSA|nr:hypothetical protein FNV43_RR26544 [Rhamnella rubrinervis]
MESIPTLAFQVKRCKPELIVPAKPTPHKLKYLSDIDDQEALRFQVPFLWYYDSNSSSSMEGNNDPVKVIREGLGKALVYYYPLAGRLKEGFNRKLMVDCNGEGVLFIKADADVTLDELGDRIRLPCPFLDEVLHNVPGHDGIVGCPLLLIQVTRLRCGGFIFALRFNHTICDAFGLYQFMNTLAEMSQGAQEPSIVPVWQREVLYARNSPRITCMHHEYGEAMSGTGTDVDLDETNLVQRSFFFGPDQIRALRNHLPPHLRSSSRFELITACTWRCRISALKLEPKQIVRASPFVTARGDGSNKHRGLSSVPLGYYGNAFAFPAAVSKAGDLCKYPLGYALELVKEAKAKMNNEEYIQSLADLTVIRGRPDHTGNFLVADTTKTQLGELNFGWGVPVYGGPAEAFPRISLHAKYKDNGEDGILVLMCLPFLAVERFEQELKKMITSQENTAKITSML